VGGVVGWGGVVVVVVVGKYLLVGTGGGLGIADGPWQTKGSHHQIAAQGERSEG